MILNKDTNPKYNLYHVGAQILEVLSESPSEISFSNLYDRLYSKHGLEMGLVVLGLDWLYIIDAVKYNKVGIVKCL